MNMCAHCEQEIKDGQGCYKFKGNLFCSETCMQTLTDEIKITEHHYEPSEWHGKSLIGFGEGTIP